MHQVHRRLQKFLQFLYYAAVHTSYAHFAIVVCGECGFVASLWEGYRTKVAHYAVVFDSLKFPQVGMAVHEYVVCESRTVLLTSSLKKHAFYNLLINNILYLCVT